MNNIWTCKIGETLENGLPPSADLPMRQAVEEAYKRITGNDPDFLFSGWGGSLDHYERAVVEGKEPDENKPVEPAGMYRVGDPDFPQVKVGELIICRQDDKSVWIQHEDGEGGSFSDEKFEAHVKAFFDLHM